MIASLLHPLAHDNVAGPVLTAYVLLDVFLIVALARILGTLMNKIGQPRVVGEILAGVVLGPTLLGKDLSFFIAPGEARPVIGAISTIALIFFMFLAGNEFDFDVVKGKGTQAGTLATLSIALPAVVGFGVAALMHNATYAGAKGGDFLPFALFIGASLSVTAFPVMAHILMERGEYNTELGGLAVATTAIMSVLMFTFIAIAGTVATSAGAGKLLFKLFLAAILVVGSFVVVKPFMARVMRLGPDGNLGPNAMAYVFAGMIAWGLFAQMVGINALVGGFLWGLTLPRDLPVRLTVSSKIRDVGMIFLLPVFFATAGFSTDLKLITMKLVPVLVVFLVAAIGVKFVAAIPAKSFGMSWNQVGILGALFNTRGLLVLVAGLIGIQLEIITPATFTIIVVVALVTNLMTLPLLRSFYAREPKGKAPSPDQVTETALEQPPTGG
jgi:Kef-type K+ transport system membrane component KefB